MSNKVGSCPLVPREISQQESELISPIVTLVSVVRLCPWSWSLHATQINTLYNPHQALKAFLQTVKESWSQITAQHMFNDCRVCVLAINLSICCQNSSCIYTCVSSFIPLTTTVTFLLWFYQSTTQYLDFTEKNRFWLILFKFVHLRIIFQKISRPLIKTVINP